MSTRRRDLSAERRREILEAFRRCIERYGLEGSSMRHVAAEAGVSQPLLMHHFGSRAGMVEALVEYVLARYQAALAENLQRSVEEGDVEALLDFLFGGAFSEMAVRDDALFPELIAAAVRDEGTAVIVRDVYTQFQGGISAHLRKAFPSAGAADCRRVAYGLVCLTEANEQLRSISLPRRRNRDTLELARALVATLEGVPA